MEEKHGKNAKNCSMGENPCRVSSHSIPGLLGVSKIRQFYSDIGNCRRMNAKSDPWTKVERYQLSLMPSSSRLWSASRNPRIVRVSRTFGGKDRHSKVCTVRGLRDRRIRLSVPTALQMYELQDKLGVGQPSKVIDWLMDITKHEIDKLPPLQIPPGFGGFPPVSPDLFSTSHSSGYPFMDTGHPASMKYGLIDPMLSNKNHETHIHKNTVMEDHSVFDLARGKGKEIEGRDHHLEKAKFVESIVPPWLNFGPLPNLSSHGLPSSSQHPLGSQFGFISTSDQNHSTNFRSNTIAPSLSLSSNSHKNPPYYSPPTPVMPHLFPPYHNATTHPLSGENNFQLFGSGQSLVPSLHLSGSSTSRPNLGEYLKFLPHENKAGNPPNL
ncbi:hypothetical protein SAY87_027061 [Trapa incisa]|uniref:TCP domain-containing protein n=1 Tax=Trapa incisa TaxID=236973 RepID=A0AAN7GYN5_9MYRT|nr:hypothetical protein SAY87_027061 [Trapa incisa]